MREPYQPRAKQFLPYASLRGFDEIVKRKGEIKEARRELAEDAAEELSRTLSSLVPGARISLVYYTGERYVELLACFREVDMLAGDVVTDEGRIPLVDLFSLDVL